MTTAFAPPRIRRGETLGICAPSGPIRPERFERGIARLGDAFAVRVAPSVLAPRAPALPSYLAASDDARADELNALLRDPDVRAILCARGGYGLMRILDRLDGDALRRDPKPIIGFSDATALLSWAHAHGVRGVHGPMVVQLGDLDAAEAAYLVDLISDARAPGLRPWRLEAHGSGTRRGPLVAGNLTLVSLLAGTRWQLPLAGAIALLEEVGERPYAIDRYLTQLSLLGALGAASALVVGDLTRCEDAQPPAGGSDPPDAALRVVRERALAVGLPVAAGAPVGHGARNEAVPFGADAILDLDGGTLEIVDAAVA